MLWAIVNSEKVVNVIVSDSKEGAGPESVFIGDIPISIGDDFIDGKFRKAIYGEFGFDHYEYYDAPSVKPLQSPPTIGEYLIDLDFRLSLFELGL